MKTKLQAQLAVGDSITGGMTEQGNGLAQTRGVIGDQRGSGDPSRAAAGMASFPDGDIRPGKASGPVNRCMIGLALAWVVVAMGCVGEGYVGGYYDGPVVVGEPDVYLFGGGYERGRDVHAYSHRGHESRGAAHSGGGGHGGRR